MLTIFFSTNAHTTWYIQLHLMIRVPNCQMREPEDHSLNPAGDGIDSMIVDVLHNIRLHTINNCNYFIRVHCTIYFLSWKITYDSKMIRHGVVCGHFCGLQLTTDPHDWRSGVSGYPQWVRLINKWSPHHVTIVTCLVTRLTDYWYAIKIPWIFYELLEVLLFTTTRCMSGVRLVPHHVFLFLELAIVSPPSPPICLSLSFSPRHSNQSLTKNLDLNFWSSSKKNNVTGN